MAEKPGNDQKRREFFAQTDVVLRRAASTLFAIEGRTARRASEARLAAAPYTPEKTAEARQATFLQAFSEGSGLPIQPTIQEIERYQAEWASLIPGDVEVRAALAHRLGEKYHFTAGQIPRIREMLGLEQPGVQQAFERLYGQPLSSIYTARLTLAERSQWLWGQLAARVENLPPFWLAYSLTLAAMIGPAALALPIAMAGIGPLAGVVILLAAGLANLLTLLALGEVSTRNGHVRGGLERLAADYLGRGGLILFRLAMAGMVVLLLLACYNGLSTILAGASGASPLVFATALFAVNLYFLRGKPREPGIATVLIVGGINFAILLALSGLAFEHLNPANFNLAGRPFDASALTLVSGVTLAAYFGHASVGGAARLALRGDPSGKSLQRGLLAAGLTAMLLYCLWVLAVNGSVAPGELAALEMAAATAISPLARLVGPPASLLGSLYAVLGLGLGSFQLSLALANQVHQCLPARAVSSSSGRWWSGALPEVVIFGYVASSLVNGRASFGGLFWFSAVALPLVAGVFPMLMLAASRRKSDLLPGRVLGWLGNPAVVWSVSLFYLAGMLLYGTLVWKDALEQIVILLAALLTIGLAFVLRRQGAFRPRLVINLRLEKTPGERLSFGVIADGKPLAVRIATQYRFQADEQVITAAEGQIESFTELRRITFTLPGDVPGEIKVWTQQLLPDGSTGALPAWLILGEQEWDLNKSGGEVITRPAGRAEVVTVVFQ